MKKSILVDFSQMKIAEAAHALEVIKEILNNAEKGDNERILIRKTENVTVPLRYLAKALGQSDYNGSIEISKIDKVIKDVGKKISALENFEEVYSAKLRKQKTSVSERVLSRIVRAVSVTKRRRLVSIIKQTSESPG